MMQYPYYSLHPLFNPYYPAFSNRSYPTVMNSCGLWGGSGFIGSRLRKEQMKSVDLTTNWRSNLGYNRFPQYWNYTPFRPWGHYPYNTWYNYSPQTYPMTNQWQLYNPYSHQNPNAWTGFNFNGTYGNSFYWPTMQYLSNQMMFPNYTWPRQDWGIQETLNAENHRVEGSGEPQVEVSKTLTETPSEVIRNYHVPAQVARKTVSDIPPSRDCYVCVKESSKSFLQEQERPPSTSKTLFKVSETSIRQIASSRSFGPSMVYTTDSLAQQQQ